VAECNGEDHSTRIPESAENPLRPSASNLRRLDIAEFEPIAGHGVDHVLARGWRGSSAEVAGAGPLCQGRF
jgi:hypothetical protein